jgi:hypothetical protein
MSIKIEVLALYVGYNLRRNLIPTVYPCDVESAAKVVLSCSESPT